jgi:hypothetical protein
MSSRLPTGLIPSFGLLLSNIHCVANNAPAVSNRFLCVPLRPRRDGWPLSINMLVLVFR